MKFCLLWIYIYLIWYNQSRVYSLKRLDSPLYYSSQITYLWNIIILICHQKKSAIIKDYTVNMLPEKNEEKNENKWLELTIWKDANRKIMILLGLRMYGGGYQATCWVPTSFCSYQDLAMQNYVFKEMPNSIKHTEKFLTKSQVIQWTYPSCTCTKAF